MRNLYTIVYLALSLVTAINLEAANAGAGADDDENMSVPSRGSSAWLEDELGMDELDENGQTALTQAVQDNNLDHVRELLEAGASVHTMSREGWTPVHTACRFGHTDILRLLLTYGPALDTRAANGYSPLMDAVIFQHPVSVRLLVDAGADVDYMPNGYTALMWACMEPEEDEDLVGAGAGGPRPGVRMPNLDIISTLLRAGADPLIEDEEDGRSSFTFGRENPVVIALLGSERLEYFKKKAWGRRGIPIVAMVKGFRS